MSGQMLYEIELTIYRGIRLASVIEEIEGSQYMSSILRHPARACMLHIRVQSRLAAIDIMNRTSNLGESKAYAITPLDL